MAVVGCSLLGQANNQAPVPLRGPTATNATLKKVPPTTSLQPWLSPILNQSWHYFLNRFVIHQEAKLNTFYKTTVSESVGYVMLQATLAHDKPQFDTTWQWAQQHLQRLNMAPYHDHLFAWIYTLDPKTGQIEPESRYFATDGDQDIAYALLMAYEQWHDPAYLTAGLAISRDLLHKASVPVFKRLYLASGDWPLLTQHQLAWDPSYFAPVNYLKFAQYDRANAARWQKITQDGFWLLDACSALSKTQLPPNWCALNYQTGQAQFSPIHGANERNFGIDAFRVFWRMAHTVQQFPTLTPGSPQAKAQAYLKSHDFLYRYWQRTGQLPGSFTPEGTLVPDTKGLAGVASATEGLGTVTMLAQQHVVNPQGTQALYEKTLARTYSPEGYWVTDYSNYLHSVTWLTLAALQ